MQKCDVFLVVRPSPGLVPVDGEESRGMLASIMRPVCVWPFTSANSLYSDVNGGLVPKGLLFRARQMSGVSIVQ